MDRYERPALGTVQIKLTKVEERKYRQRHRNQAPKNNVLEVETTASCQIMAGPLREVNVECILCGQTTRVDQYQCRCLNCGYVVRLHTASIGGGGEGRGGPDINSRAYNRQLHLLDVLKGRSPANPVDPASLSDTLVQAFVEQLVREENCRTSCDVTLHRVYRAGRALGHTKLALLVAMLTRLTGCEPPRFSPLEINYLCCMFQAMQEPFEKFRNKRRVNFLHYKHTAFSLLQLLGEYDHLLWRWFSPMLGASKMREFDEIFANICGSLGWQVIPTRSIEEAQQEYILQREVSHHFQQLQRHSQQEITP